MDEEIAKIQNRRHNDAILNEVKGAIIRVETRQEDYIKQIELCANDTKANTEVVGILKTKMNLIIWIGSGAFLLTAGAFVKNYLFKSLPPS